MAISAISVVELTHGIFRARNEAMRQRRETFAEGIFESLVVHPVSYPVALLAGRIEGEQASRGVTIAFEDLLIGATALHHGFAVATRNVKHFALIPGLKVTPL